jgi:hypothetical protein
MNGSRYLADSGNYRTGSDPMQVGSGPLHNPKVHFEAPPSSLMTAEMKRSMQWFAAAKKGFIIQTAPQSRLCVVMIPELSDENAALHRFVYDPMFGIYSARPVSTKGVFKWFRFANTGMRISDNIF